MLNQHVKIGLALMLFAPTTHGVWLQLDDFSTSGVLDPPGWFQATQQGYLSSDGNRAFVGFGHGIAVRDDFPETTGTQRVRMNAYSSGTTSPSEHCGAVLGFFDISNYLEVRLLVDNVSSGRFYRAVMRKIEAGTGSVDPDVVVLPDLEAVRLDAWVDGTTMKIEVQPIDPQNNSPVGSAIGYTWDGLLPLTGTRFVGMSGYGAVTMDDYEGFIVPEPGAIVFLACGFWLMVSRTRGPR